MIIHAIVKKEDDSDWWIVTFDKLDHVTQGEGLRDAVDMGTDLIRCVANDDKLPVEATIIVREAPLFRHKGYIEVTDTYKKVEYAVEPNETLFKAMK